MPEEINHEIIPKTPYIIPARAEKVYPKLFLMGLGINLDLPGGEATLTLVPANDNYTEFSPTGHETLTGSMEEWRAAIPEVGAAWIAVSIAVKAVRDYERAKLNSIEEEEFPEL